MTRLSRLALALLVAGSAAAAQDTELRRQSLKGLKGVEVLVERLDAEAERVGLNETTIQTDVELMLRQAGIRVLTPAESLESPGRAWLYVSPALLRISTGEACVYTITVELRQDVRLERDLSIEAFGATTWNARRRLGIVPTASFAPKVRDSLKDLVDQFINAYLSVNRK